MVVITHPEVIEARNTCIAAPDQWEGRLACGRYFYLRLRFGRVLLGLGHTPSAAVEATISGDESSTAAEEYGGRFTGCFESDDDLNEVFARLLDVIRERL